MGAIHKRPERRLLVVATAHRLGVDPEGQLWVGMAHLLHDVDRIVAEGVQE
jgi:ligand-binding sensor domain-containing protein